MATIRDIERHLTPELRAQRREMLDTRGLPTLGFYEPLMAYPALPARVREAEVLIAALEQRSAFEWQTHAKTAAAAGVEPALFDAIGAGRPLDGFGAALDDVLAAVRSVVRTEAVAQDVFDRLTSAFGLAGAVEVVTLAAMYRMFASLSAAFESRMPEGTPPPPWTRP